MNPTDSRAQMRTLLSLASFLLLFACDKETPSDPIDSPTPATVVGNYNLLKIDSAPLPFVALTVSTYSISITSGSVELKSDGTYRAGVGLRVDDSGNIRNESDSTNGTWTLVGDSIRLANSSGQTVRAGRILSGTFHLRSADQVWELRK
jgi:hypothetical protein